MAVDVTGSMGDWLKIIWDKLPMFYGQLMMHSYVQEPAISFSAIGDAVADDPAPLQVGKFSKGGELDKVISKIWPTKGGGGNQRESYELAAYYYANHTTYDAASKKGFFFITGDEGFYSKISPAIINKHIGDAHITAPISATDIFKKLQARYHVFLLHKEYWDLDVNDEMVKEWHDLIGKAHVLELERPKAIVDIMLGVCAMVSKGMSLAAYISHLKSRGQDKQRCDDVKAALTLLEKELGSASAASSTKTSELSEADKIAALKAKIAKAKETMAKIAKAGDVAAPAAPGGDDVDDDDDDDEDGPS